MTLIVVTNAAFDTSFSIQQTRSAAPLRGRELFARSDSPLPLKRCTASIASPASHSWGRPLPTDLRPPLQEISKAMLEGPRTPTRTALTIPWPCAWYARGHTPIPTSSVSRPTTSENQTCRCVTARRLGRGRTQHAPRRDEKGRTSYVTSLSWIVRIHVDIFSHVVFRFGLLTLGRRNSQRN